MKQNERFLVYAVTGCLALILVVAIMFSRGPGKDVGNSDTGYKQAGASRLPGLGEMLGASSPGGPAPTAGTDGKVAGEGRAGESKTGVPSPNEVANQPPLMAQPPKTMLAAELVAQQLGVSRRDRTVRFVRAKNGDSLDQLVRRWCGARDPFLAEAKSLNEDLVVLRVGQEVAVPWVEDEVLLAALDAQKPKTLVAQDASLAATTAVGAADASTQTGNGEAKAAGSPAPTFLVPGNNAERDQAAVSGGSRAATGRTYTIQSGDSLWKIAERTYGKKDADRMIREILAANPGLTDKVRVGQKIKLPAATAKNGL